jgi:hypothetical protein
MVPFNFIKGYRGANTALLITNVNISDEVIRFARELNIIIIDRKLLKAIIKKQLRISDLLEKSMG